MSRLRRTGFTLIELLIVVAIIAILAAIAVPNFLEAQTRAKVSRVQSDLRTLATGLEAYRVDHNRYPTGTDNPALYPAEIGAFLGPLASGYYTFMSRTSGGGVAGRDFATLTTPVAYLTEVLLDPFAKQKGGNLTYQYRNGRDRNIGFIITSFGPDADVLDANGKGILGSTNPLSTTVDTKNPSRMGEINERDVIHYMEGTSASVVAAVDARGGLMACLLDLTYDPTNGTISDGDIWRINQ
jgi:prepilin-type N-terminal cleavage/methylation domain-containing protein